jgi:hypothetical protein
MGRLNAGGAFCEAIEIIKNTGFKILARHTTSELQTR